MTLHDVESKEQFEEYYKSNNLLTTEDKVANLRKTMDVKAILCDEDETLEETLAGLEESALFGFWNAS